jgi:hypothetical protein
MRRSYQQMSIGFPGGTPRGGGGQIAQKTALDSRDLRGKTTGCAIHKSVSSGFFSSGVLQYFTHTGKITPLGVVSDAFPGNKMWVHLLTAPCILVIWAVTHPSTNRTQRCLTLVIKWVLSKLSSGKVSSSGFE